jgi:O-antigen ligase
VVACGLVFLTALATTIALGATYREGDGAGGLEGGLRSVLTERRVAAWHSALEIMAEEPGGVGPGRFDDVPPRLLPDGDARWAENDFLQQGAELGWLGLILTVLLFLWGFARSLVHPAPDASVALGAVALAALGIQACLSHVLHVPAVPLVAAALIGSTQVAHARGTGSSPSGP